MNGFNRGAPLRADFADVLETVLRDSGAQASGESAEREAQDEDHRGQDLGMPASFDFLQGLDLVSEQRVAEGGTSASASLERYEEAAFGSSSGETAAPEPQEGGPESGPSGEAAAPAPPAAEPGATADPVSLASELGLRPGLTPPQLRRIRRSFALDNHPDRLDPGQREAATRRMTAANSLIDEALRQAPQAP